MADAAAPLRMSAAEYLAWEREQREKHEFHDGDVFAMAGGSPRHNYLALAIGAELRASLRGGECRVLPSDQRVAAVTGKRYVYPDCVVACEPMQFEHNDVLATPATVVEVLSSRTERYDRGEKWAAYQQLATLGDYLLVDQHSPRVEHFQRDVEGGGWRYRVRASGDTIELVNGARVGIDALYEGAFDLPSD